MKDHDHSELGIDPNEKHQRLEWAVQRCAWVLLALLLLLVALGLFGRGGPLSEAEEVSADGGVRLGYERFVRRHSPATLMMDIRAPGDTLAVRIDSEYMRRIELERVTPQPARVTAEEGALAFVFNAAAGAGVHLTFEYRPNALGSLTGWIEAGDQARLNLEQFVYP